ncbi:MAG: class I SAM-dependent methyltransferase [Deltaproteobacteria bacterium]|nr:class I SAM-dependent methyltransferase [Deltaproteobacteria bacterium]
MSEYKEESRRLWNANPCGGRGGGLDDIEYATLDYFRAVRYRRYEVSDPWIRKTIDFNAARGKRLLEIGFGIGTDLLSFCEGGAEVHGIDITDEHFRLAKRNFELHGRRAELNLCDAACIEFPSGYFDFVYSLGVLHHTPDTVRCVSEAYRVLKPGGRLILGVYHTFSAFHLVNLLLYNGLIKGKLRRLGYRGLLSTVERGADGMSVAPLVKTYGKRQLRHILSDFSTVEIKIAHFRRDHVPYVGRFIPVSWEEVLGTRVGWYLVAFAAK